ncbi:MAG TPA: exonuclease domain-containing protein, partial [Jatrophihabitantaceae bacterium]
MLVVDVQSPPGYAVVDVETTGLSPSYHHKVVEIAVVQLDQSGKVEREWTTLVNPGRDVGARHIHGITAEEVVHAPTFADLTGYLG